MPTPDRLSKSNLATSLRASLKATFSPATAQLLQEAVKADPDFGVIASILKLDPALAAAILSLVNSPYYGQASKISDLQRAATILGNNEILRIAMSLSLQKNLNTVLDKNGFDTYANWRIIVWAALGAELIAQNIAPREKETAYICTLVKDLSLLLYAATYPEEIQPHLKSPDFVNTGPTYTAWQQYIPKEHTELTADLLREWNFPEHMIEAITAHHDLAHVFDYPPLTQAVIFGTRWAEVEFRTDPSPNSLEQLNFLLKKANALPQSGLEGLRQRCSTMFSQLCSAMSIKELPAEDRLYVHSVQSFQDFHFQAKEIEALTGGNSAVADCIARHLRWNWNCRKAEIILYAPGSKEWELYALDERTVTGPNSRPDLKSFPKNTGLSVSLQDEDGPIGELRLGDSCGSSQTKAEMTLYGRLLSRCYANYMKTLSPLEIKADLLDNLPAGVALANEAGHILKANPIFGRLLGLTDGLTDQLLQDLLIADQFQHAREGWLAFLANPKQPSHCSVHCPLGPDSGTGTVCFSLACYRISQSGQARLLILLNDLREVRVLEFEALHQRDFLTHLLSSMQDLVMTIDQAGIITFASGRHGAFLTGKNLFQITAPASTHVGSWDKETLEQCGRAVEAQIVLDGDHQQLELVFSKFSFGNDYGLIVGRNISLIRRLERKIKEQALFDALTQVFNRHHLLPLLEREISRTRRTETSLGLIFFDIDKFKQFNDTHGHHGGDKALKDLGKLLRGVLRKGLDYPCRFGGDEFVIVSSNTNAPGLLAIAQRIQNEFKILHDGQVTLSVGMSLLEPEDTSQSLLERCDKANYQAKAHGGNTIVHLQDNILS